MSQMTTPQLETFLQGWFNQAEGRTAAVQKHDDGCYIQGIFNLHDLAAAILANVKAISATTPPPKKRRHRSGRTPPERR